MWSKVPLPDIETLDTDQQPACSKGEANSSAPNTKVCPCKLETYCPTMQVTGEYDGLPDLCKEHMDCHLQAWV